MDSCFFKQFEYSLAIGILADDSCEDDVCLQSSEKAGYAGCASETFLGGIGCQDQDRGLGADAVCVA